MKTHTSYVGQKVRALKFLKGAKGAACLEGDECAVPLLVAGGYDSNDNSISLLFPQMPTLDQMELAEEFEAESTTEIVELSSLAHAGDVTSLGFLSVNNADFVVSGSSNGSLYCSSIVKSDASLALQSVAIPQWENVAAGSLTGIDADMQSASIVAASESGQVVWANLDRVHDVRVLDIDGWAVNDVKMLGVDSHIVLACANPTRTLQLWDLKASERTPASTCADSTGAFTCLATHPTRPELLLTGSSEGYVSIWDRRMLANGALRTERKHRKAVRSLKCHDTSPGFIYSCGDDNVVLGWDFYATKKAGEKVDYERHTRVGSSDVLVARTVDQGILPWNALDVDGVSNTLVAGSDNHSILLCEDVSVVESP
ncbi:Aste57867_20621 [Aphanomyces stellatus]|uniref:Aste57867_20621 protein n=1 Tax=Aphanomyces stellatus TaxID=120398 RepID=A0A485LGU3_9STRA|nr:hypothetical protein As57867_020553 [Aphanomyces stellatus]VFT97301.1 Aste57867_20621 [Aphanomyces stellatus]